MIKSTDEIVSIYYRRLEHGYPTPSLDRDNVLNEALPLLRKKVIRFAVLGGREIA
jgi:hypothetical protein